MARFDVNSFYIDDVLDFVRYERAGEKMGKEKTNVRKFEKTESNSGGSEGTDSWKEEFDY